MTKNRNAFHINSEGTKPDSIQQGILWLDKLIKTNPKNNKALIVVNQLSVLDGVIADVLSVDVVKALKMGKKIEFGLVGEITAATERTIPSSWNGSILAIYPSKKMLDKIDTLSGVTDILIIPWVLSEMLFWIETWSSQELNSSKPIAKKFNLDPIVETALKSLTKSVNLSTGLAHPSDRTSTIQMFEILLENNISYNLDEVRAWLVSKGGWRPSDADKVVEIGQGVLDGKNFRTKGRMWRENIIDIWRLDAAKNTSNP